MTLFRQHPCRLAFRSPRVAAVPSDAGFTAVEVLIVAVILSLVAAMAIPFTSNTLALFRVGGDSRALVNGVSMTKMRAASDFTRARFYVDLAARSFRVEVWQKTAPAQWVQEGGTTWLSQNDNFSFGSAAVAPTDAVSPIAQAPPCLDSASPPNPLANTACIVFNSRGIPVDSLGAPTAADLYITDGITLFGVAVSASGQVRLWRASDTGQPIWTQQ